MALDGVVDPRVVVAGTEARFADTVANTNAVLADFEALCESAGPDRCALAGKGPVAARVDALLARLRRGTIPAPTAEPPGPLTYNDVLLPFFVSLQDPSSWPQFAIDLDQAASGDGSALATAGRAALAGLRSPASDGPAAITCTDSPAQEPASAWPRVIGRLTRISPLTGPVAGWSNWAPCASWPARAADRYTGPWTRPTRRPILLVGTTADPSTPYANARAVARLLGNAALLTHDGYGHTSDADPSVCVTRATRAYLVDLTTPPPGTVCPSDRQPFDPDFGAPLRSAAGGPGA
jgi:hypothetical protein